jgi:hypothetical protein
MGGTAPRRLVASLPRGVATSLSPVVVALLLPVGAAVAQGAVAADASTCFTAASPFEAPVRIDERNQRLFVVARRPQPGAERLRAAFAELAPCLRAPGMGTWKISLFSDRRFAGYKDEPSIKAYVRSGEWAVGYLGEYDGASRVLTLDPLTRPTVSRLP